MDPTKTRSPFPFPACFQKYLAEAVGDGSEVMYLSLDRLCSCTQRWRRAQAESEGTKTRNQAGVWARQGALLFPREHHTELVLVKLAEDHPEEKQPLWGS